MTRGNEATDGRDRGIKKKTDYGEYLVPIGFSKVQAKYKCIATHIVVVWCMFATSYFAITKFADYNKNCLFPFSVQDLNCTKFEIRRECARSGMTRTDEIREEKELRHVCCMEYISFEHRVSSCISPKQSSVRPSGWWR